MKRFNKRHEVNTYYNDMHQQFPTIKVEIKFNGNFPLRKRWSATISKRTKNSWTVVMYKDQISTELAAVKYAEAKTREMETA